MGIERVYVIGAGLMGHGIAQVSAAAGKAVTLADRTAELAEGGQQRIAANLERQVAKGKLEQSAADETLGRIGTATGSDGVAGHDIVIEAIFEDEAAQARDVGRPSASTRTPTRSSPATPAASASPGWPPPPIGPTASSACTSSRRCR